ncbi:hypothetical protein DL98DRAFT_382280, partial [Cadophora sp. DSE1049]
PAELLRFANWAFGPNGLPTLQVLAFGDFYYDGRSHIHNKLFCRHTCEDELILTFRHVIENDTELWDLIDRNTEFLEACPTDSIV